ncbi:hypothetical protein [Hyalangium versicolor]|uniref:hypothetical protein n=1 Tax=Hyalangium versicolor TaxID=2861190 RepID=UPI001CCD9542|nr:hypothetical protein [Hyalangium versicolor]
MTDDDWDRPFLTKEEMREAFGDPKEVTPEVVAWVNAKARELRATSGVEGLMEAFAEGRQRFPKCGRTWSLLYFAFASNEDITLPEPPSGSP